MCGGCHRANDCSFVEVKNLAWFIIAIFVATLFPNLLCLVVQASLAFHVVWKPRKGLCTIIECQNNYDRFDKVIRTGVVMIVVVQTREGAITVLITDVCLCYMTMTCRDFAADDSIRSIASCSEVFV